MDSSRIDARPVLVSGRPGTLVGPSTGHTEAETGRTTPTYATPLPAGVESFGPAALQWGREHLSTQLRKWEPMPWQEVALGHQLAHVGGHPVSPQSLATVARQNGKSEVLKALAGWVLTERCKLFGEPQMILSTADQLKKASRFIRVMARLLEEQYGAKVIWSYGREEIVMPCGCEWHICAPNESAGHSFTCDLVIVDEVWAVPPVVFDEGLVPTTRARRDSLIACWSTAGTEKSEVMLRQREAGLQAIDAGVPGGVSLVEWSVPADMDPADSRWWGWANPAMGQPQSGLTLDKLQSESTSMKATAFLRASLNMWVPASDGWLEAGEWGKCAAEFDMPAGGYVAVEQSLDESRFVGLRAVGVDGQALVATEFVVTSEQEMWARLVSLAAGDASLRFAVGGSMEVHIPPQIKARTELVGASEIRQWVPLVQKMIRGGHLRHRGEVLLGEHVGRAVGVKQEGGIALSSARSPGPIELARCLVWATALATKPGKRKVAVGLGGGGR